MFSRLFLSFCALSLLVYAQFSVATPSLHNATAKDSAITASSTEQDKIAKQINFLENYKLVQDHAKPQGYFYDRFVAKDVSYLKNKKLPDASSFFDAQSMEKAYKEIIKVNHKEIQEWLSTPKTRTKKAFKATFTDPVGYGLKHGKTSVDNRYCAVLVLDKSQDKVKIIATFPVEK